MVWTRPKNDRRTVAQKDVGLGTKQEKKKGEDPDKTGERTYTWKWNRGTYDPGTGRIGKHGRQDVENSASCNKAAGERED